MGRKGVLILFIVLVLLTVGCSEKKDTKTVSESLPENEIIFIQRDTNGAWGYYDSGCFIVSNGDYYTFDFGEEGYAYYSQQDLDFMSKLQLVMKYSEPATTVDMDILLELYNEGLQINADAEYEEVNYACDMGQDTIYFVNPTTGKMIECYSYGDTIRTLIDNHAKKINEKIDKLFTQTVQQSAPHLYTTANIPLVNANCGYYSDLENQYILTGESELMDFQTNTGVDVSVLVEQVNEFIENRGGYEDYSYDDFIYIIRVDTVNSTGYYLKSDGLIYDGENYTFALSSECKIPGADEIVGDMMDGFCYMAAIPYLDSDN